MDALNRRRFLRLEARAGLAVPAFLTALRAALQPGGAIAGQVERRWTGPQPVEYAALLHRLLDEKGIVPDSYSLGGSSKRWRSSSPPCRKERAISCPRTLATTWQSAPSPRIDPGDRQEESHLYQDEGTRTDAPTSRCALAAGHATFLPTICSACWTRRPRRVRFPRLGDLDRTPVRRKQGQRFDPGELEKIVAIARRGGIRLHLDGARLFLEAAYSGKNVADYSRPFDTVYVSLYKYFNAASGAILAGPRELVDGMYHTRRMFGGGLNHAWPFALVALHYLGGFSDRFAQAVRVSEDWIRALRAHDRFTIDRVPLGHSVALQVRGGRRASETPRDKRVGGGATSTLPDRRQETLNRITARVDRLLRRALASVNTAGRHR